MPNEEAFGAKPLYCLPGAGSLSLDGYSFFCLVAPYLLVFSFDVVVVAALFPLEQVEVTLGHVVDRKMREMGYIRKPAVENLKNRRTLRDRVAAEGAPEVRHTVYITLKMTLKTT